MTHPQYGESTAGRAAARRNRADKLPREAVSGGGAVTRDVERGLGTASHADLRQQAGDVVLHGLLRQTQPVSDLPVREALRDQVQDPMLLIGERREPRVLLGAGAQALEYASGDLGVEQRLTAGGAAHGVDQLQ